MLYPHGKGNYQQEAKQLWKTLVPDSGQAETVQGEMVRCVSRLGNESYRNGNGNWDRGFVMMAEYLSEHLRDGTFDAEIEREIVEDVALVIDAGDNPDNEAYVHEGNDSYTRLTDRVVEWCHKHSEPIAHKQNPKLER